jgi:hypothetical protein
MCKNMNAVLRFRREQCAALSCLPSSFARARSEWRTATASATAPLCDRDRLKMSHATVRWLSDARFYWVMHANPCARYRFGMKCGAAPSRHCGENPLTATKSDEIRCGTLFIIKGGIRSIRLPYSYPSPVPSGDFGHLFAELRVVLEHESADNIEFDIFVVLG